MGAEVVDLGDSRQMSINREKILRQLARVHNQAAEGDESLSRTERLSRN
jgi:hypothetical protein